MWSVELLYYVSFLKRLAELCTHLCVVCALPKVLHVNLLGRWKYNFFCSNVSSRNGIPRDLRIRFARLFTFITLRKKGCFRQKMPADKYSFFLCPAKFMSDPCCAWDSPELSVKLRPFLILNKCCDWLSLLNSFETTVKNDKGKGREFTRLLLAGPRADLLIFLIVAHLRSCCFQVHLLLAVHL